ncbi:TonB-dependent receptor [Sphingomonas sp. LY54]|uniref:TonB-dependent receptor plug domain-containing protein n=1 Tax=Sphingomonas sp. LY54 TaxID=3095343 RepID=UPI002D78EC8E|nr:TonB-dependent receptor [Sphingomonas sp. LY54]WRP29728.1 TonB-dependent receptor [Sphingomonas sp. LY54]
MGSDSSVWKRGASAFGLAGAVLVLLPSPSHAQSPAELGDLSIEELAQVQVTSVSKRAEPLSGAPAAIYVISNEDLMRATATSLPEALRLAPNLQAQRIDARQYAVSARGFNGYETANKMLALIDGRSIYTPLFSAIFWELHAPVLEDVQQIEVVSGPGGTLYGPNAVNGVINISTKDARDTLGGLARATVAANERTAALRYGMPIGETGAVRVYGNYFDRSDQPAGPAGDINDRYRGYQAGFRMDLGSDDSSFTLQGDLFDTEVATTAADGEQGHNILARWTGRVGEDSNVQLQAYYDKFERQFLLVRDSLETFDVEGQFTSSIGRHDVVVGAGARTTKDLFENDLNPFVLDPESDRLWTLNMFVQDRYALSDRLSLTAGVKFERSSFSGWEILPNLRLAWQPSDRTLLWSAVSRAVRTPSRIDRDLNFLPILAQADDFASEKVTAIEAGYRGRPTDSTTLSVSIFYNLYDDLRTTEFASGGGLPIRLANGLGGETWGVEAWATQQLTSWWRLRLGLSTLGKSFAVDGGHADIADGASAGNDPDFKLTVRSQMNLASNVDLDLGVRVIDDLERPEVDSYVEAQARLGWRVTPAVEFFVAGNNLLRATHEENGEPARAQRIERSIHAGTRLRF